MSVHPGEQRRSMKRELREFVKTNDFTKFYTSTHEEWIRIAKYLLRRWECPPSVDLEDIVQEMSLAVITVLPNFNPDKGITLERFIVWNACDRAKKWMHGQRAALRRSDKSGSRFPIPASYLNEWREEDKLVISPKQIGEVNAMEVIEKIGQGDSKRFETLFTLIDCNMCKSKAAAALHRCSFLKFERREASDMVNNVAAELYRIMET